MRYRDLQGEVVEVGTTEAGDVQFCCPGCKKSAFLDREHKVLADAAGWLTIEPSIICPWCQWHGYVTAGQARAV